MKPSVELAKRAIAHAQAIRVYFPSFADEMAELGSAVMAAEGVSYWISPRGDSITCTKCRMTSRNPSDVEQRYCGNCHVFHAALDPELTQKAIGNAFVKAHKSYDWLMAAYLKNHPDKMPGTTTLAELMMWSYEQTLDSDAAPRS